MPPETPIEGELIQCVVQIGPTTIVGSFPVSLEDPPVVKITEQTIDGERHDGVLALDPNEIVLNPGGGSVRLRHRTNL